MDFLSSLLERAQGRAPVLERRKPGVFEPAAVAPGGLMESEETVPAEVPPRRQPQASVADLAERRPQPPAAIVPPPTVPAARPAEQGVLEAPPRILERESRTVETRLLRETVVEREIERTAMPVRETIETPAPRPERVEPAPPVTARPLESREPEPRTIEIRTRTESTPSPQAAARPVQPAIQPAPRAPRIAPRVQREPAERAPAPAPPEIHVSIGRVEIRATPPVARPRGQRLAEPKLKLEEYLRSRNGGRE